MPATERDRHITLGFEAYRPVRPLVDKIRAENLLWHSLRHAEMEDPWRPALRAIQARVGRDRSSFGVFFDRARQALAWELRVLNSPGSEGDPLGVLAEVREAVAPWFALAPGLDRAPPYAILGLRFDGSDETVNSDRRIETVELHARLPEARTLEVHRTGAGVRERVSTDVVLEPKRDIDQVLPAIKSSAFVDFAEDRRLLGRVLVPELFACRRLYISKRRDCDAIGFSGVNIEQLLFAHIRFEFPPPLIQFLRDHRDALEHLLFDVTVEYLQRDGDLVHTRCGFHSTL